MSGPTTITAPYRISFLYTVSGFQHRHRNFCDVVSHTAVGDTVLVKNQGSGANPPAQAVADDLFGRLVGFYDPSWATFDGWVIDVRAGTEWIPFDFGATSAAPGGSGVLQQANAVCISGKSSPNNRRLPQYFFEGLFGGAAKVSSPGGLGTISRHLADWFFNFDADATNLFAWAWALDRHAGVPGRWLAWVVDTNEKLRRTRRIK